MSIFDEMPMDTKVRETALRIMERAMFYNSTSTERELTGSKTTFFVNFSGHVAWLEVQIYSLGYAKGDDWEDYHINLCGTDYRTVDEIQNQLVSVLKRMEAVYTAWYEKENPHDE